MGWANLAPDLLAGILAQLPCLAHRALFTAACANWHAVAAQHPPPPQLPWLLLPSAEDQEVGFYCISCNATHRALFPDEVRTARCCGSGSHHGGWVVLALHKQEGGLNELRNLHTGRRLDLPDGLRQTGVLVSGATFSAAPTSDGACVAVLLAYGACPIAFWRQGMEHLSPPTPADPRERASWRRLLPRDGVADVIYSSAGDGLEGFCVLTNTADVLIYIPEISPDGMLTTRQVTFDLPTYKQLWRPEPFNHIRRYLLNLFGHLVMVVRFFSKTQEKQGSKWIDMFILKTGDRCDASWEPFYLPENVIIVLGRCSSRAYLSPGIGLSRVYFLDDVQNCEDAMVEGEFPCRDMGRSFLQKSLQVVERIFPVRPASQFSPAVWFFQSDATADTGEYVQDVYESIQPEGVTSVPGQSGSILQRVGGLGRFVLRKMVDQRKDLVANAPIAAEFLGWVSPPMASFVRAGVNAVNKIDQAIDFGKSALDTYESLSAAPMDRRVVGTVEEAKAVIADWIQQGRPNNMSVEIAHHVSKEAKRKIELVFVTLSATDLLLGYDYQLV